MRNSFHWGPISIWHHRILGGLWALVGLCFMERQLFLDAWDKPSPWIALAIGAVYLATSIGFIQHRAWARRVMGILMVIASLWFLDMLLMFALHANRPGMCVTLTAAGISAYTLTFLALSAAWHSQDPN